MEILSSGILGSLLGGVFRLAPELMKVYDRKNERSHELQMFDRQCNLEEKRGQQKLAEIGAERDSALDISAMDALKMSIQQQTDMVKAAGSGFISALSASVRPVMTYYLLVLYGTVKAAYFYLAVNSGVDVSTAITASWTNDDIALLSGVVNYYFLDRTIKHRGL